MITVFTTFTLPKPITREEARSIFLSTAPKYRGVQGLFRKIYVLSEDGVTVGGVYWPVPGSPDTLFRCNDATGGVRWEEECSAASSSLRR